MITNPAVPEVTDVRALREQVESQAQTLLRASPFLPLRKLTCEYHEGVLTLRGKVPTFYLKQLAQTRMQELLRVEEINNQVEVVWPTTRRVASTTVQVGTSPQDLIVEPLRGWLVRKSAS